MPTITVLANGAQFYVRDATAYRNDARFAVGDDQQQATGTTTGTGGVAIDPTVSQSQWLLNYLLSAKDRGIAQFGADTNRMGTVGNLANTQYGNETSRAGVVGNLYSTLFGTPANYGAVSNLMRGQPNASGLSFWNALSRGSHLGEGATDPRGQLHNVDPDQVISDLFGGVAASGRPKASSSSSAGGSSNTSGTSTGAYSSGSGTQQSAAGQGSTVQGHVRQSYGGYAGGGDIVVNHPATLHLADGRVIPIGEYGRPEQLTVTPLATNPLPPRYYAGLMAGNQDNGAALGTYADNWTNGPPGTRPMTPAEEAQVRLAGKKGGGMGGRSAVPINPGGAMTMPWLPVEVNLNDRARPGSPLYPQPGLATGGTLDMPMPPDMGAGMDAEDPTEAALPAEEPDVTNPTPDPRTLAEITAVLHTPPALHPSPIEQAIRANWTLDARGHPQFTGARPQQQAPQAAGLLPGMALGGALTFGGGAPAVLYPNATVRTSASAPSDTGQVTSAGTHAGQTSTGPYYNRSPWNDPRYAQTQDIQNLSPLEKSLLESTTAAMGLPASEWWAIYQRSRPSFQNAAVGAGFTRAA